MKLHEFVNCFYMLTIERKQLHIYYNMSI